MIDNKTKKNINNEHLIGIINKIKLGDYNKFKELMDEFKYINLSISRKFYAKGMEKKDLIQEGYIALWKAVLAYKEDSNMSFESFAKMVIKRKVLNYITVNNKPLNINLSLYSYYNNDINNNQLIDYVKNNAINNPEELYIKKEESKLFKQFCINNLTLLEKEVLEKYLEGKSYKEISEVINKPPKSVDNAIRRAKNKIRNNIYLLLN